MHYAPVTKHPFKLTGMKVGDTFMGCRACGNQLPVGTVGPSRCQCLKPMWLNTVTTEDLKKKL